MWFSLYFSFTLSTRESYGEDIADTDTQRSDNSEEDEYEGSFIDDEDPKVFPPSPVSNGEGMTFLSMHCRFLVFSFSSNFLRC